MEFSCSTNIDGARVPRGWVINGTRNDIRGGLPEGYSTSGLSITFEMTFNKIVKYQCYFRVHVNESDIDIYSNEAFLVPHTGNTRG